MLAHSKIGASSCERWWNCPGSVAKVASLPPQPDSLYALEGTAAHALAEYCLETNDDAINCIGLAIPKIEGFSVTEEMAEAVQVYLDVIRADMAKYNVHPADLKIEHRFHLSHIDESAFGTNDANIQIFGKKIIVYDYKHGKGVAVDAEDNKQGLYYATGAAYGEDFEEVEIVIVQPRAIHRDGPVRRWRVSKDDLLRFSDELKGRIKLTKHGNASLHCGEWCKKTFCPAMATCPAVQSQVEKAAMVAFSEPKVTLKAPEELNPMQLRRVLENIDLIEEYLKAVYAYAETKANNGEHIDGFKLVRGREGNRKWSDEGRVAMTLKKFGDAIYDVKLKTPPALEKAVGKVAIQLVGEFITRTEGKTILVPTDDPREAVSPQITNVFKEELI